MSEILNLKSSCQNAVSRYGGEISKAKKHSIIWNDKVGIRASQSIDEVANKWSRASEIGLNSANRLIDALINVDAHLENVMANLQKIKNDVSLSHEALNGKEIKNGH